MKKRWTNQELSEIDDITFAMSILSERCNWFNPETPLVKKLLSARYTLDVLRGGHPIDISSSDTQYAIFEHICNNAKSKYESILSGQLPQETMGIDDTVIFRAEYEIAPIRHLAVRCPSCKTWVNARAATRDRITDIIIAEFSRYACTSCGCEFCPAEYEVEVEECNSSEQVYRDCVK